jgi:5-methylcytosine-specific restriction endonuclease McrA
LEQFRTCRVCKQIKPSTDFGKRSVCPDGIDTRCRQCSNEYLRSRRANNPERVRAKSREWNAKNPEKVKAIRARHRKQHIEYNRGWYQRNKEHAAEMQRLYRANNREKTRGIVSTRRAKIKNNVVFFISKKEWQRLYSSSCFYCGSSNKIEADHVIPTSRGGCHSIGNLVPACKKCNIAKNDRTIMEWRLNKISFRYRL